MTNLEERLRDVKHEYIEKIKHYEEMKARKDLTKE